MLDDSPVIINWNALDPTEQAEITPTLGTSNNWIIFTHPLGARRTERTQEQNSEHPFKKDLPTYDSASGVDILTTSG